MSIPLPHSCIEDGPLLGDGFDPLVLQDQYVLLVHQNRITVLSLSTGALLFETKQESRDTTSGIVTTTSCCVHNKSLWLGQSDGTLQEYHVVKNSKALVLQRTVSIVEQGVSIERLVCMPAGDEDEHIYAVLREASREFVLRRFSMDRNENSDWQSVELRRVDADKVTNSNRTRDDPGHLVACPHGVAWGRGRQLHLFRKTVVGQSPKVSSMVNLSSFLYGGISALSCNSTDLAVGLQSGVIQRFHDVWTTTPSKKKKKNFLVRRMHWHSHAVSCLVLSSDQRLHSGGEESVWVIWDATGDRPVQTCPRLGVGQLDALVLCKKENTMLIANRTENTIRACAVHTLDILWKHGGFPSRILRLPHSSTSSGKEPQVAPDNTLLVTRNQNQTTLLVPGPPGKLVFFDPRQRRVVTVWVVCPYNHVSRVDGGAIPRPCVTAVASYEQQHWLTVHVSPTDTGPPVCTLQFWENNNNNKEQRDPVAIMSQPHGHLDYNIHRVALHKQVAVTLGKDSFRMWHCMAPGDGWTCSNRVTIPCGYANLETAADPAFSSDGSVLAVTFGSHVTLWRTDPVQLLSSIPFLETNLVHQVVFCSSVHIVDLLLVRTDDRVVLVSVKGDEWWSYETTSAEAETTITHCMFAPHQEIIAVATATSTDDSTCNSIIVLIDATTGRELTATASIPGKIDTLTIAEDENFFVDVWAGEKRTANKLLEHLELYATTEDSRLYQFRPPNDTATTKDYVADKSTAPRLPQPERTIVKKRRLLHPTDSATTIAPKVSLDEDGDTDDIPLLRGSFVTAFVGRNIRRRTLKKE